MNRCCFRSIGGLIGCILVLPLNNITTGVGSFMTFSEIAFNFRVSPEIMLIGIAFALFMGARRRTVSRPEWPRERKS